MQPASVELLVEDFFCRLAVVCTLHDRPRQLLFVFRSSPRAYTASYRYAIPAAMSVRQNSAPTDRKQLQATEPSVRV